MKAKFSRATGNCDLQIVINFESDEEKLLAKQFLKYQSSSDFVFHLHSYGGCLDSAGWDSMNFGFIDKESKNELKTTS